MSEESMRPLERRRSSGGMYDPARDVFQPTAEGLSAIVEETTSKGNKQATESAVYDVDQSLKSGESTTERSRKRQRPASPPAPSRMDAESTPPKKKIKSPNGEATASDPTMRSISDQTKIDPSPKAVAKVDKKGGSGSAEIFEREKIAQHTKTLPKGTTEVEQHTKLVDLHRNGERDRGDHYRPNESPRPRARSPVRQRIPQLDHNVYGRRDSPATSQRGRSPEPSFRDRRNHDERRDRDYGSSRRSRSRSPVRRRVPKSESRSVYSRRDDPPDTRNRGTPLRARDGGHGERSYGKRDRTDARRSWSRSPSRRQSPNSRRHDPPPSDRLRSPSPITRSPPREEQPRKRAGGGRNFHLMAAAKRQEEERERDQQARNAQLQRERGVQHQSNEFYNARPEWVKERGREWRTKESKIKGLRSFNNWIKSCMIQKFSPEEAPQVEEVGWGEEPKAPAEQKPLLVLDIGCGKGGDLGKWQLAPQTVGLYVGLDPAETSISQAGDRYHQMRRGRRPIFDGRFHTKDCFGEWVGDIPIVREVGIDPQAGQGGPSKWAGGGFDVVTMMFSMHYSFEDEGKASMMLRNVAGSLKKGGRFIGVVPNSDAIAANVVKWFQEKKSNQPKTEVGQESVNGEKTSQADDAEPAPRWGNSIYRVTFPPSAPRPVPESGIFRDPPFGWKYLYWMDEAVDVPEYVVPWEAFRAVAEGYNLEQRYRKPFLDIWEEEGRSARGEMGRLAGRMGVSGGGRDGLAMSEEEREAVGFYHAFCFVKV